MDQQSSSMTRSSQPKTSPLPCQKHSDGSEAPSQRFLVLKKLPGKNALILLKDPESNTNVTAAVPQDSSVTSVHCVNTTLSSTVSQHPAEEEEVYVDERMVIPKNRAVTELCGSKELMDGRATCHLCPAKFGNIKDLLKHSEVEHNGMDSGGDDLEKQKSSTSTKSDDTDEVDKIPTYFKCGLCSTVFAHETSLQLHLRFHALENNVIICKLCGRELPDEVELIYHEMAHQHLGDFLTLDPHSGSSSDETCDEVQGMKTVNEVLKSMKTKDIHTLKTFVCSTCPMKYTFFRHALVHLMTSHPTDAILTCPRCGYHAEATLDLREHIKQHNLTKLGCPVAGCSRAFCREIDFLNHLDAAHTNNIVCEFCGRNFDGIIKYRSHRSRAHSTHCFKCNMDFDSPADFKHHVFHHPNHSNNKFKLHPCPKCGKKFKRTALICHLRIHYEVLRLPCKFCSKTFQTKQNLNTHMRVHTRERPFLCNHCGKSFSCKASFHHHMKMENLIMACDD